MISKFWCLEAFRQSFVLVNAHFRLLSCSFRINFHIFFNFDFRLLFTVALIDIPCHSPFVSRPFHYSNTFAPQFFFWPRKLIEFHISFSPIEGAPSSFEHTLAVPSKSNSTQLYPSSSSNPAHQCIDRYLHVSAFTFCISPYSWFQYSCSTTFPRGVGLRPARLKWFHARETGIRSTIMVP